MLAGLRAKSIRETGPKETRAEPLSAQWQAGNIDIVEGSWNRDYLREMAAFPGDDHDDYVDASSGAFLECVSGTKSVTIRIGGNARTMNAPVRRNDGYMNVLSGLNTPGLDRSVMGMNTTHRGWRGGLERYWSSRFSYLNYGEIYYTDGLAQKIIDKPADDCFKEGLEVEGDDSGTMEDEFDRLAVYTKMADAVRWARLYGGAAIVMIVKKDGV